MTLTAGRTDLIVTTRPTDDSDAIFMFVLYASTRADDFGALGWSANQNQAIVHVQAQAQETHYDKRHPALDRQTVYVEGLRAGRILVDRTGPTLHLVDISLLPRWRGNGVGTQLLRGLLAEAKAAGRSVQLEVAKTNPAIRLYERLGFGEPIDHGMHWGLSWPRAYVAFNASERDRRINH